MFQVSFVLAKNIVPAQFLFLICEKNERICKEWSQIFKIFIPISSPRKEKTNNAQINIISIECLRLDRDVLSFKRLAFLSESIGIILFGLYIITCRYFFLKKGVYYLRQNICHYVFLKINFIPVIQKIF